MILETLDATLRGVSTQERSGRSSGALRGCNVKGGRALDRLGHHVRAPWSSGLESAVDCQRRRLMPDDWTH